METSCSSGSSRPFDRAQDRPQRTRETTIPAADMLGETEPALPQRPPVLGEARAAAAPDLVDEARHRLGLLALALCVGDAVAMTIPYVTRSQHFGDPRVHLIAHVVLLSTAR